MHMFPWNRLCISTVLFNAKDGPTWRNVWLIHMGNMVLTQENILIIRLTLHGTAVRRHFKSLVFTLV